MTENSPIEVNLGGAIGALSDLIYAGNREQRLQEEHELHQIGQSARNIRDIVTASQVINDPRTPQGIRAYAEQQLNLIVKDKAN